MASLNSRLDRLKREIDGSAEDEIGRRWERQRDEKRAREEAAARRRWFYWSHALILQRWPGGPEKAEDMVISGIARVARETRVYPNQWRCGHHIAAALTGPHAEKILDQLRWALALLELRGQLWPVGCGRDAVDPEERTHDEWIWAFAHLLEWLSTIDEHPAWAYTGWPPDMMRDLGPRLGYTPGRPIDQEKLAARVALAEEATAYPKGHPLPPCAECMNGDD